MPGTMEVPKDKRTTVVIPTRGKPDLVGNVLRSLALYNRDQIDVVLVEHETNACAEILEETFPGACRICLKDSDPGGVEIRQGQRRQSYSTLNNFAVAFTSDSALRHDFVWLLNNDVIVRKDTLEQMISVMDQRPDVGIVGAKLIKPNEHIQHIGVVFDGYGVPYHLGYDQPHTRQFLPAWRSDYFDAVTFACALIRRDLWEKLGGLDTDYFFNYEDVDFCLRAREEAQARCFVNMAAVATHLEGASDDHRQTEDHSRDRNLAVFKRKWVATDRLEKLIGQRFTRLMAPSAPRRLSIAFIPCGRGAGVAWWRMDLPAKKLAEKQLANVQSIHPDMPEHSLLDAIQKADVAVWQGWFLEHVERIAKLGPARGCAMVYEMDDHPIYLSPFAQVYRTLGTQEIKLRAADGSEQWLWRDGEHGFNLEANRKARACQLSIMSASDAVTTTTEPLAEYFRTLNRNVYVLPNCIDFEQYPAISDLFERRPGPVRIGWWGGDNHWHDVSHVGPWLTAFINKQSFARLIQIGAFYKGPFRGIDMNKVEEHAWVHVEAFPWKLGSAGIDIVVIPLANPALPHMQFNQYKSPIKWLEAAALKLPCLVQGDAPAYSECVDDETALTFISREEFLEKLERLCRDPELRARIGQNAYDYARENYDLDKNIERWLSAYEAIDIGTKKKLAQAAERVPASTLRPARSNAGPGEATG